jgi:hypothetical protein
LYDADASITTIARPLGALATLPPRSGEAAGRRIWILSSGLGLATDFLFV